MGTQPVLNLDRERQLVGQVHGGDRGALGELLNAYHKRVYHVCLRMVGKPEDAADLTQEALLRAIRHIDEFKGNSRFGTWLMRIAMNLSISHMRKRRTRGAVSLEHPVGTGEGAAALRTVLSSDREPAPSSGVETREQVTRLTAAIEEIDVDLRSVLVLRDLQGMDYQGIAETLTLPIGTVKSRLFRARLALRQAMDDSPARPEVSHG